MNKSKTNRKPAMLTIQFFEVFLLNQKIVSFLNENQYHLNAGNKI